MGSNTANTGLGRATNSRKGKLTSKYNTEPRLTNIMNSTITTELSGITIISNNDNNNNKKKKEKKNFAYNEREPGLPIVKNSNIPNIKFGNETTISQNQSKFKDNEENRPGPSNMKRGGKRAAAVKNSKHNGTGEPGPSSNPVIRLDNKATAFDARPPTGNNVTTTKLGKTKKTNNDKKNKLGNISNLPNKKPGGKATKPVNKKQRKPKNGGKENKEPRKKLGKVKTKNNNNNNSYREKLNMDIAVLEQLRNLVTESDLCDYPLEKMIRLESIARPFHMTPPLCVLIDLHGCNRIKAQCLLTAFQSLEPSLKYTPRVRFVTGTASTREHPAVLRPLLVKFLNQAFPSRQKWESAAFIDLEILGVGPIKSQEKTYKANNGKARVQNNDKSSDYYNKYISGNKEPSVFKPQIEKKSSRLAMDTDSKDAKRDNVKKNLKKLATLVRRICKSVAEKLSGGR